MKKLLSLLICVIIIEIAYGCYGSSKRDCLDNNYDDDYSSYRCCWLSKLGGFMGQCEEVRMSNFKSTLKQFKLLFGSSIRLDCSSKYLSLFSFLIFAFLF